MKTKSLISGLILITILGFLIYYLKNNLKDFQQLAISNLMFLIPLIIIFLLGLYFNGMLLNILMRPFSIKLKNLEAFGLAIITNFYNLITPFRGGAAARAYYLKKKYKFPYVNFLATLSAIYLLIFLISAIIGLITLLIIKSKYNLFNLPIFLLFSMIIITLLTITIFSPKLKERENKWLNRFIKIINGWHLIKNNKNLNQYY